MSHMRDRDDEHTREIPHDEYKKQVMGLDEELRWFCPSFWRSKMINISDTEELREMLLVQAVRDSNKTSSQLTSKEIQELRKLIEKDKQKDQSSSSGTDVFNIKDSNGRIINLNPLFSLKEALIMIRRLHAENYKHAHFLYMNGENLLCLPCGETDCCRIYW